MSARVPRESPARNRSKYGVFAFVAVMTAYVLYHNERFLIDPSDPEWPHISTFKWWLLPHAVAGASALLLAPMQFSDRLRRRYARLHRVVGRVYVGGVLVLAPLGAYIQYFEERLGTPRSFTILTGVDAALLIVTTVVALTFAVRRKIGQHRQWMTRSYAVGLVFFEGRFILGVTGWESSVELTEAVTWSCLACAILFADLANNWFEIRSAATFSASAPRPLAPGVRDQVEGPIGRGQPAGS